MPYAIDRNSVTDTNSTRIRHEFDRWSGTVKNTAMATCNLRPSAKSLSSNPRTSSGIPDHATKPQVDDGGMSRGFAVTRRNRNRVLTDALTLGDVSQCSGLVAVKEAVDSFLYSLPDLGLAGFGPPAAGGRKDHVRGNEIEELARADSRIHFAQSSSCHLLIKVTSE